jgi:hypothetical protein
MKTQDVLSYLASIETNLEIALESVQLESARCIPRINEAKDMIQALRNRLKETAPNIKGE